MKKKLSPEELLEMVNIMRDKPFRKGNTPYMISTEVLKVVEDLRKIDEKAGKNRNQFIGWILSYHLELLYEKSKKKSDGQLLSKEDLTPVSLSPHLSKSLKSRMYQYIKKYNLTIHLLLIDILHIEKIQANFDLDIFFQEILMKKNEVEDPPPAREQCTTKLPFFLNKELNDSPLSLSGMIEIYIERYLEMFSDLQ
ncbi:hypothetical protein J2Z48_002928 [Croceifilum oryzae]|uniref:Uncharacterized protein n=1 Tax=Croceifilum oryzae TaxID=1553429 RepID=A0AAJ1THS8_9BACL|nr:hypothetical protein [Croceifilum oryzae]MDQ0418724.1 hypothetical protein [Croceifilum oryzae]